LIIHKPLLGSCKVPHKIWARNGSAFLTFIGYKQTNRHPSKEYIYWACRALLAHLLFQLWVISFCIHCKTKTKRFRFYKKNRGFSVQSFIRYKHPNKQKTMYIYIDIIAVLLLLCPELNQSRYNQSTKNINQNTIHMATIPWTINTTITKARSR